MMKKFEQLLNEVVTIKMNSGEEMIAKIILIEDNMLGVSNPVSVAPGPQGLGLIPSMYTADPSSTIWIRASNIAVVATTEDGIKMKYVEATTGLTIPAKKKIILT